MSAIRVDACGCACPEPVLKVKKAMAEPHDIIEVLVDNNTAVQNIKRFAASKGYDVTVSEQKQDMIQLTLQKK